MRARQPVGMTQYARAFRTVSGVIALVIIAGVAGATAGISPAEAAGSTSSELTVAWAGDGSSAREFQPTRVASSPYYGDFDRLRVTVSQTTGIVDQTVRVNITGFAPTLSSTQSADGFAADSAKNYIQAMQCWGPDPKAADFNETCQWGGRVDGTGVGSSVLSDNLGRVGPLDVDFAHPTTHDVPFRTPSGRVISGKPRLVDGLAQYDMLNYFSASTTNEVASARMGADGTGTFDFETQSADSAPQLGCGSAGHLRCWLVIVPRGTHFGGDGEQCSGIRENGNNFDLFTRGQRNVIQGGSPVNDNCDYFDQRLVVPLDFRPTGVSCAVGSVETRVIGSQLMTAAMSSWQPSLCQTVKSTFSFATNADVLARAQLIDTGANSPTIAYSGYPVSSGELTTEAQRTTLAKTSLAYVPVAVSSIVVGFVAESAAGRQESLVISPRLMAKYLTQSYPFLVPQATSSNGRNATHLGAVNQRYTRPFQDPEFQKLNPSNYNQFQYVPALVLPGSRSDGIKQVWRWVLSDPDARSFMSGTPDPWGMTVNPYYLPKDEAGAISPKAIVPWYLSDTKEYLETATSRLVGLTNLDGTPRRLIDAAPEEFAKYDQTVMPLKLATERSRFDSIQFAPYADSFSAGARQSFRADSRAKTFWDPNVLNAVGEKGDWKSSGSQVPGQRFMLTVTDSVSAQRWGISSAALTAPGTSVTASTVPATIATIAESPQSMLAAFSALEATSLDTVKQVNPAKVGADGWPMTIVTYAGVNLTKSTADARRTIAGMLTQVTTSGQILGTAPGELPDGYLPLPPALQEQATTGIAAITSYVAPAATAAPASKPAASAIAQDPFEAAAASGTSGTLTSDPTVVAGVDELSTSRTVSSTDPLSQSALVVALIVGLAGLLVAPVLLRGRGFL